MKNYFFIYEKTLSVRKKIYTFVYTLVCVTDKPPNLHCKLDSCTIFLQLSSSLCMPCKLFKKGKSRIILLTSHQSTKTIQLLSLIKWNYAIVYQGFKMVSKELKLIYCFPCAIQKHYFVISLKLYQSCISNAYRRLFKFKNKKCSNT